MPRKSDRSLSPAESAVITGALGTIAANSSPAEYLAFKHFTRQGSPFRPYSNTRIAPGLFNGSGEAMMTVRWQDLLRRHGIDTTYAPSYNTHGLKGYDETIGGLRSSKAWRTSLDSLSTSAAWNEAVHPGQGVKIVGLKDVLAGLSKKERAKFISLLEAGKYDKLSPALLRDFAKLDKNLLFHPERLGANGLMEELGRQGKAKMFFNAFRGFTSGGWEPAGHLSHAQNWFNTNHDNGMFNLGRASGFQANYDANSPWFIPGTKVYDNWMNRNPLTARFAHLKDRNFLEDKIRSISGKNINLDGKKLIFMDSGSVGPNNSQKIIDLVDAVKGRKDVHILFQHGKDTFAKDLLGDNGVLARLMRENPGLISAVERVQPNEMARLINGANLHVTYGGSSSAGEAGSHLTPTIFTRDGSLNEGNLQYVMRRRNSFGGTPIKKFHNVNTAIATAIDEFKRKTGQSTISDSQLEHIISRLDPERRVDSKISRRIARKILKDPDYINKIRAKHKAIVDELLSDAVQNNRYSPGTIGSLRKYIDSVRMSDQHMVDTTKGVILNLLRQDDSRRVKRLGQNIRTLLSGGRSSAMRSSALRRVLSLKGLRDANLALGGLVTKNPIGRRLAVPVAALTGLASGGTYLYNKHRNS